MALMSAQPPATVLMGHDVRPAREVTPDIEETTAVNAGDLELVLQEHQERGYRFVGFDEFMAWRGRGGVALLTFDDAYCSVATIAQPILRRLGIPALVFAVSGGVLGRGDPFPHFLHELQESWPRGKAISDHPLIGKLLASSGFASLHELFAKTPAAAHDIFAKALRPDELQELSAAVIAIPGMKRRTMDADQVARSIRAGQLEYGAHSVTHRAFVDLGPGEIEREVIDSAETLAELTGKPPGALAFAYPYGFVTAFAAAVVARTYRAGFTCHARPVSAIDRSATLPRYNLDRRLSAKLRTDRSAARALASARERALLYARTDLGRRVTAPLKRSLKALGLR